MCVFACIFVQDHHVYFLVFSCADRDYQQGQGDASFVSACRFSGRGTSRCDTGHEAGLERRTREEAELRGDLQTGKTQKTYYDADLLLFYLHCASWR